MKYIKKFENINFDEEDWEEEAPIEHKIVNISGNNFVIQDDKYLYNNFYYDMKLHKNYIKDVDELPLLVCIYDIKNKLFPDVAFSTHTDTGWKFVPIEKYLAAQKS